MFDLLLSHPQKPYENHIQNMIDLDEEEILKKTKLFHDTAKLKENFQTYIRDTSKNIANKNHSLLSAYFFILNSDFDNLNTAYGFFSIVSHHGDLENFFELIANNKYLGKNFEKSKEFDFWEEVAKNAKTLAIYKNIKTDKSKLLEKVKHLRKQMLFLKFEKTLFYKDFIDFKYIYSDLIYSDKYEAIFSKKKELLNGADVLSVENFIAKLKPNKKRDEFKNFVLKNFDKEHKLFTLSAPTGYGKTLTALNFALKFKKQRVIFALPFTSIIDQTEDIISNIFKNSKTSIYKIHHKTTIDENVPEDRYSKIKFLLNSFSGDINITTLYQIIFAIFGNKNKDNVKFNQLKNSVVIIDEAQSIPYKIRKDFIKLCEEISLKLNTVFIFMSATMPIIESKNYKELSNLKYFQNQNRYVLKWFDIQNSEENLISKISYAAKEKHTLVVVNTIKKAQELYLKFSHKFECFCLNGYMTDIHKQETIEEVKKRLEQNDNKILLISTQSIEAGVDLDFEIGFREICPISSIIQTAGRINRNFGQNQGILYIFDDISKYTNLIYGDLQTISEGIIKELVQNDVNEKDILKISNLFFQKIHEQLENLYLEDEMRELRFFDINKKVDEIMNENDYKILVIIEPYGGFVKEIESSLQEVINSDKDKFTIKDIKQNIIKKLTSYGVNISIKDKENIGSNLQEVKYMCDMQYLPSGSVEYSYEYGFKKNISLETEDIFSS